MPKKLQRKGQEPAFDVLAPEARPALEALGPERPAPRRSTPLSGARSDRALPRLRAGAGHGGSWDGGSGGSR